MLSSITGADRVLHWAFSAATLLSVLIVLLCFLTVLGCLVAVAVIRAFDMLTQKGMSDVEVDKLAFECEKVSHGTPSGVDNNIATY